MALRDIKQKIRAVRNIEQICRAMKTVASIRLHRAEERLDSSRPYRQRLGALARRVAAVTQDHPFLQPREVQRTGLVVVTSDRGLCGGYNASVIRRAAAMGGPPNTAVIAVGRRGLQQMRRRGYSIIDQLVPLGGEPDAAQVWRLAARIGERYLAGEVDRVVLVYSRYLGATRSEVVHETLLPVTPEEERSEETIFEPEPRLLLGGLLERHLRTELLGAVLESAASEHGARVAAMTAATDNADEMIRDLTLSYNKARQAAITKELTEIVSAAEAAR